MKELSIETKALIEISLEERIVFFKSNKLSLLSLPYKVALTEFKLKTRG